MKLLLTITAIIELGAGAAFLAIPSEAVRLLLGAPLDAAAAVILGRVTGAALTSLSIACWFARSSSRNPAALGLAVAMTFYNVAVAALLAYAGLALHMVAMGLWPAAALHAAMATWCIAAITRSTKTR